MVIRNVLKMEASRSSETLVSYHNTTPRRPQISHRNWHFWWYPSILASQYGDRTL